LLFLPGRFPAHYLPASSSLLTGDNPYDWDDLAANIKPEQLFGFIGN
jgi:hypothetical protein